MTLELTIDEKTGLPEVPEDMHWEIVEAEVRGPLGNISTGTVSLKLNRTQEIPSTFLGLTWGKKTLVCSVAYGSLMEDRLFAYDDEEGRELLKVEPWVLYDAGIPGYFAYKVESATRESILELSHKVWYRYIEEQQVAALKEDAQKKLSVLVGSYPPKRLA